MAQRAEKVFMTHMEIIRLKYPGSLNRLRSENRGPARFGIKFKVRPFPVVLLGAGVFLPHGENVSGPVEFTVSVRNSVRQTLAAVENVLVDKSQQLHHSKMCINHKTGVRYMHFYRADLVE